MQVTNSPNVNVTNQYRGSVQTIDSMINNLNISLNNVYGYLNEKLDVFSLSAFFTKLNHTNCIDEKVNSLTKEERLLFQNMDTINNVETNLNKIVNHIINNPDDINIDGNELDIEKIKNRFQNSPLEQKLESTKEAKNIKPIIKEILQDPEISKDDKRLLIQSLIKIDIDIH